MSRPVAMLLVALTASNVIAQTVGPAASQPTTPDPAPQTAAQPQAPAAAPKPLEVINEGAEPRFELRYTPTSGASEPFELRLRTRNSLKTGESTRQSGASAEIRYECTLAVQSIDPDGNISYSIVFDKTEVLPDDQLKPTDKETLTRLAFGVQGAILNVRIDSRGRVLSSEVMRDAQPFSAVTFEEIKSALAHLTPILPDTPVGTGASWKVASTPPQNGLLTQQTATYSLTKLDAGAADLGIELVRTAEPQDVKNGRSAPGTSVRVERFAGAGVGRSNRPFSHLIPTSTTMTIEFDVDFVAKQEATGGKPAMSQAFAQTVRHEFAINPR